MCIVFSEEQLVAKQKIWGVCIFWRDVGSDFTLQAVLEYRESGLRNYMECRLIHLMMFDRLCCFYTWRGEESKDNVRNGLQ